MCVVRYISRNSHVGNTLYKNAKVMGGIVNHLSKFVFESSVLRYEVSKVLVSFKTKFWFLEGSLHFIYFVILTRSIPAFSSQNARIVKMEQQMKNRMASPRKDYTHILLNCVLDILEDGRKNNNHSKMSSLWARTNWFRQVRSWTYVPHQDVYYL